MSYTLSLTHTKRPNRYYQTTSAESFSSMVQESMEIKPSVTQEQLNTVGRWQALAWKLGENGTDPEWANKVLNGFFGPEVSSTTKLPNDSNYVPGNVSIKPLGNPLSVVKDSSMRPNSNVQIGSGVIITGTVRTNNPNGNINIWAKK